MRSIPGFERFDLPTGARYLKIHHYADPAKDEAWLERVRQEMSDTPTDFRRQILMEEDVYDGQAVFPEYADDRHSPIRFRHTERIPIFPRSLYVGGWDCGMTLNPAFVLFQIPTEPFQVHCLLEVVSDGGESMETFAPRVIDAVQSRLPGLWDEVRHVGDHTVTQRAGTRGETAQQIARGIIGTNIEPISNTWGPRKNAVAWMLTQMATERAPMFVMDGGACPTLRQALKGAYHFETSARGDQTGTGRVIQMPLKNGWSHVADALQYAALKAKAIIGGTEGGRVHRRGKR